MKGDLVLYGRGDPTLGTQETSATLMPLDSLATQISKRGIKRIQGKLLIDVSYYSSSPIGANWAVDDLYWGYGAKTQALTFGENTFTLTVQAASTVGKPCQISVDNPPIYPRNKLSIHNRTSTVDKPDEAAPMQLYRIKNALYLFGKLTRHEEPRKLKAAVPMPLDQIAHALKTALNKQNIQVDGDYQLIQWPTKKTNPHQWTPLATLQSPPLAEIVHRTLKHSNNLYAQSLLLQLGCHVTTTHHSDHTTEEKGCAALTDYLSNASIPQNQIWLEEGSGLSRRNLVTPDSVITLLQYMNYPKTTITQSFQSALPIASRDGSLKNRMKETPAENNVQAKAGGLKHVHNLAGYVTTTAGERLAFVILLNNYATSKFDPQVIDAIAIKLAQFSGHS